MLRKTEEKRDKTEERMKDFNRNLEFTEINYMTILKLKHII